MDGITARWIIERLFPEEWELLYMYFWMGMTQEKIASEMGIARSTVANKLRAVLDTCRDILEVQK
jgi:predicted DNA-binding protein (UPF0251 family)